MILDMFPLADFGSEVGPIVATICVMLIPIIAILTSHQRKMAMIIHGSQQNRQTDHSGALASEVQDLKQVVYQQSIAIDAISSKLDKMSADDVQHRLTGTSGNA